MGSLRDAKEYVLDHGKLLLDDIRQAVMLETYPLPYYEWDKYRDMILKDIRDARMEIKS